MAIGYDDDKWFEEEKRYSDRIEERAQLDYEEMGTDTDSCRSDDSDDLMTQSDAEQAPTLAQCASAPCFLDAMRSVVDVAIECNVPHKKVRACLRRAFLDRAEHLPRFPVIYSVAYRGFGFSKAFEATGINVEHHTDLYNDIVAFGNFLCEQVPVLRTVKIPRVNRCFSRTEKLQGQHGQAVQDAILRCTKQPGFSHTGIQTP